MKKVYKTLMFIACFYTVSASAGIRCNEPTLKNQLGGLVVRDAYRVLTWAEKCRQPHFQVNRHHMRLQLNVLLANSEDGTKGGMYFAQEGTPEYESQRRNVLFPVFFVPGSIDNYWKAMFEPGDIQTRIFSQDCSVTIPAEFSDVEWCESGCFAPDQNLLFADEKTGNFDWMRIDSAFRKRDFVAAVSQNSTLGHINFVKAKVRDYITDLEPDLRSILRIDTASGKQVKVTPNHPLLDANGLMRRADSLTLGEALVTYKGEADEITKISQDSFHGRVYNLDIHENRNHKRIVTANGILSGTNWYQNRGRNMLDRVALRGNLSKAIMDSLAEDSIGEGQ